MYAFKIWKCYWLSYFWITIYCLSTILITRVTKQPQTPIANNSTVWRAYGWHQLPSWVLPTCTTHLYCWKHVEYIFCMQQFDSGTCIRKHTISGYADSFLKTLNAKQGFHAHQVSTRTQCVSLKGIASKVQNSCSAKPSCAELCEY